MAPSGSRDAARTGIGLSYCAAQSTIALERAKINPTLVNGFAWSQWNLRRSRKSSVSKTDRLRNRRPRRDKDLRQCRTGRCCNSFKILEGFDFVAFLLGAVVAFFSVGFAIDYIVGRYGMGPYWNGFYAMLGAYAGLCARDWWLQPYAAYDPYLTTVAIAGGLLTTVVMVSAVAKR